MCCSDFSSVPQTQILNLLPSDVVPITLTLPKVIKMNYFVIHTYTHILQYNKVTIHTTFSTYPQIPNGILKTISNCFKQMRRVHKK